ncbi:MAG: DEAD/DEAH box helicase [Deltaproteobacteria bacterium]|nr:DEAD/DEAH box helicase [Deltaproteobacteria bacterium]
MEQATTLLARLAAAAPVSDSVRCWALTARLGLELAARQRVVPTVHDGEARWRALLARPEDRQRFLTLVEALPTASRALPTDETGPIRLHTAAVVVRRFLDDTIDCTFRRGAYPGPSRGWELELAESLRGVDPTFSPRDARFQGVPAMLEVWTTEAEAADLRLGMTLSLPEDDADAFGIDLWLHPLERPDLQVPVEQAWSAASELKLGGRDYHHPAHAALRGLARAARIFTPLSACLSGDLPHSITWDSHKVWEFLSEGAESLRDAGFRVKIPDAFEEEGNRRLRARMHVVADPAPDGSIDLSDLVRFRWEVVLGDQVVDGNEFAELCARREPVVRFRGGWVLLDPAEIERLPEGLPQEGALPAAVALRAILIGEYAGVPVVADRQLDLVIEALRNPPPEPVPRQLMGKLRPYQRQGFSWLTTMGRLGLGALLADDMGLGKTIQVLTYLLRRRRERKGPSLVVSPTSVLANWQQELDRFAPSLRALRYHGLDREVDDIKGVDVVLTTYGVLARDLEHLEPLQWDVVILDEAQAIKKWSLMEFLTPGLMGPRARFQREVAVPVERFGDQDIAEKLRVGISPFLLRRLKTDPTVISDLPEKIEGRRFCALTPEQTALYQQVVDGYLERISDADGMERRGRVLAMLTALKQVCNHPSHYLRDGRPLEGRSGKLETTVDLLDTILDGGESVLLFTQYREMGELLRHHLDMLYGEAFPFLHGGTPANRRESMVRTFQQDEDAAPILIVSLRAGGTGLNLTRATHVIHYDRWWNPAVEDQASDRAYRIGQRRNVVVHKLITEGTLEERIDRLLEEKRALADQVVGGGERWVTELDDHALRRLVALGGTP